MKFHWIIRLWHIVVLILFSITLGLGVILWISTGNVLFITRILLIIICVSVAMYFTFSVNIFRKTWKLRSRSERLLIYLSALGLYLFVVSSIFFIISFILLQLLHTTRIIFAITMGIETAIFIFIGYISFTHLKHNLHWFAET